MLTFEMEWKRVKKISLVFYSNLISKFILRKLKPKFGFFKIETTMQNVKISDALFLNVLKTKLA